MTKTYEYEVEFKYKDAYSRGDWSYQAGLFEAENKHNAIKACIETYGLEDASCYEYEIISVTKID